MPYAIVDEGATADELARYRAVIIPTLDRMDQTPWEQIRELADTKRAIVVIGPGTPTRDEFDQPLAGTLPRRIGRLKAGSLDDLAGLAEDLAQLAGELGDAWQVERPDDVRVAAFARDGVVRVIFASSDVPRAASAVVLAGDGVATLRDAITGEQLRVVDGRVTIPIHPRGVRMFVVSDRSGSAGSSKV